MAYSFLHHDLQIGIIRNVCELHDQRTIADFVLHRFCNLADQMRIVAQQTIMPLIRAAGVHFHQASASFGNQMRGGDMIGNVRLAIHAFNAGSLKARHQQLAIAGRRDRLLHIRLPLVRITGGNAKTIGNRNRKLITGVGKHTLVKFGTAGNQRTVSIPRMHGKHVRERIATPCAGANRLIHGQIETHTEGSRSETLVQQRTCRNAERQIHAKTKEFLSLSLNNMGSLISLSSMIFTGGIGRSRSNRSDQICRIRRISLQHFGKRAERPLQIVVFIRAIDIIKRRETLTHISLRKLRKRETISPP